MNTITANELKKKGVGVLEAALKKDESVAISVRGKPKFVVVEAERFEHLWECELLAAVAEAKQAIAEGRLTTIESVQEHMERLKKELIAEGVKGIV